MRLVHGDEPDVPPFSQVFKEAGQHQPLRRGVEQAEFAVVQTAQTLSRDSSAASEEFRNVAAMPLACSASTWSFISAISGETTTVRPSRKRGKLEAKRFAAAGRQQRETSLPASESRMISSCNGRNEVKPKYCFSSGLRPRRG
jgi:hypothetical protein